MGLKCVSTLIEKTSQLASINQELTMEKIYGENVASNNSEKS